MRIRKGIIVTMSREIENELREHKCSECKRPVYTTPQWVYKTRDKLGYTRYQCSYSCHSKAIAKDEYACKNCKRFIPNGGYCRSPLKKNCKYKEDLRT